MPYKLISLLIFLILVTVSYSTCPNLCSTCQSDNITCLSCIVPHTYIPSSNTCQYCNINCTSCSLNGTCLGCINGLQPFKNTNGSITCVTECRIPNCATCTTVSGQIVCQTCANGFFYSVTYGVCFACKSPCNVCTPDTNTYANKIYPYWRQRIQTLFSNSSSFISPNGTIVQLPDYLVNIQNQNTYDISIAPYWSQAYYLYFGFLPLIPVTVNFTYIVLTAINTVPLLSNKTIQQTNAYLLNIVNQILILNYTLDQYMNKIGAAVSLLVPCSICNTGYGMNITNSSNIYCQTCNTNIQGCLRCTTLSYCDQCIPGRFSTNIPIITCQLCSTNCATCTIQATNCLSCYSPYSLSNTSPYKSCILCIQPCLTCLSVNISSCITCKLPYSKYANSTGYCYRCIQDTCTTCDSSNISICIQCNNGYILNNGICNKCNNNCNVCNIINTTNICYQCKQGYILNNTSNICIACGIGCISCNIANISICYNCRNGMYYQVSNNTCVSCLPACVTCNSSTTCVSYKDGIVVYNNIAVKCRIGCNTCNALNPQLCTQCSNRYVLVSGQCKACPKGCQVCTSPTVCTICLDNLNQINSSTCKPCQGYCRTCNPSNLTQCTSCILGTNLINNKCTRSCSPHCIQCSDSNSQICLSCNIGYTLTINNTCIKCIKQCNGRCDPYNINICIQCIQGYYLNNGICIRCIQGCITCTSNQCINCINGYTLTIDNSNGNSVCKLTCNYPCITCTITNTNNVCTQCNTGYILIQNTCYPDISCNPNCQYCPIGTYNSATLPSIVCNRCIDNCANCANNICTTCNDGYYLNTITNTCTVCSIQCRSCYNDPKLCKLCNIGYTKQLLYIINNNINTAVYNDSCIVCDSNCKTCDIYPYRCISCIQGMYLIGYKCVNMYTVQYKYEIDYNYDIFMNSSQSQKFIGVIAAISEVSINDTYITSILQGSTVISGMVSSTGQANALYIQSTLARTSISQYTVLSTGSTVYYGDTPQYKQQQIKTVNIGLIVGVTIGGLVAILLIIFIIYKLVKMKKSKKVRRQKVKVENIDSIVVDKSQQQINYYVNNNQYIENYGNINSRPSYLNRGETYNTRQESYINSMNSNNSRDDIYNKSSQTFISKVRKSKVTKIKPKDNRKSKLSKIKK